VLRNPTFDPRELQRVRAQLLSRIAQESTQPTSIALRELPPLIYGRDHPYGVPFTGSGTAAGVTAATRDDLVAFHRRWIRPDNGRVFVVGDVTMAEIRPLLEKSIGTWRAPSEPKGSKAFRTVQPSAGRVILIDRPGSPQSLILAGHPLQTRGRDNPVALYTANDILGGNFTSRLNRDLRETKGWAYGVGTQFSSTREQLPFILYAPVQTDRTGDSIKALTDGMRGFLTAQPATAKELGQAVNNSVRSLPGSFESAGDVLGALERNFVLERPDDYQETLDDKYRALTIGDLSAAAKAIDPSKLIWVVVGDRAKVEPQLRTLGLPIEVRAGTPAPAAE
jgi:predicted Zn-dependent peptidase